MSLPAVKTLSNRQLLTAVKRLVKTERVTTLDVLVHLGEIERRELYLELGYGSMFEYCIGHLGYSRSAAGRRIHAARCVARYPELHTLVETNALCLTTLSMIAPVLDDSNKRELLERVRGKSQDEVEAALAAYRPPVRFKDRVKPVRVAVPLIADDAPAGEAPAGGRGFDAPGVQGASADASAGIVRCLDGKSLGLGKGCAGRSTETSVRRVATNTPRYQTEKKFLIQFTASEAFMAKYQEARSLLSNTLGGGSFESVFEAALDCFLDKHSPARRQQRRESRKALTETSTIPKTSSKNPEPATRPTAKTLKTQERAAQGGQLSRKKFDEQSRSGTLTQLRNSGEERDERTSASQAHAKRLGHESQTKQKKQGRQKNREKKEKKLEKQAHRGNQEPQHHVTRPSKRSRYIPAKTRDAVFTRDNGRCTHVGTSGKRCRSTHRLHIDHIVPFARGGTNALSNLRLLCAKHNHLEAKRIYGAAKMDAYRERE